MPIICRFYGIIVVMFWRDHNPPHFHARYGGYEIEVNIRDGLFRGVMPHRALMMIQNWRKRHIAELLLDWTLAQRGEPLAQIEPLE
ncbi:MAG: DUF4160 domain-containing protein [Planctomycetes bacterium]|nr:DUF4160 domain-containing protein [Planctomycetota bacterium]